MKKIKQHFQHIRFFIDNDFKIAINSFHTEAIKDNNKAGCYSLLRIIFPLIDHVSQLVNGSKGRHSLALKNFISNYFGKVNSEYKKCAGLLVYMYRHGLLHQLQPNRVKCSNTILEWNIYYREKNLSHLSCLKEKKKKRLYFDIEKFADDFLKAFGLYEADLVKRENTSLRKKFKKVLNDMNKAANKGVLLGKDWLDDKDFLLLTKIYNNSGGIQ